MGSVSPLIAVWQALKNKTADNLEALFIGTYAGPEKEFLSRYPIIFKPILAGKLRRYFSLKNFLDPFLILLGCLQSLIIILKFKPKLIISAGSFAAVPVILIAKILNIKVLIHQLDLQASLSNRLVKNLADKITVTFKESLVNFPKNKTACVGAVLREEIKQTLPAAQENNVLILGGGTGALTLNQLIAEVIPLLPEEITVNHVTGKNKAIVVNGYANYNQCDLLAEDYYAKIAAAQLVVSRAGLGALTELAYLTKPTVIIPIASSQQEKNAEYFADRGAAVYLKQTKLSAEGLTGEIVGLLKEKTKLKHLSDKIHSIMEYEGAAKMAEIALKLLI